MSKFTGHKRYKYKTGHQGRFVLDYYDSDNKIPKVRFKKGWHETKDRRCWFYPKQFYRDMEDGHFSPKDKERRRLYTKLHKLIKHKLYFNIPITEEDWRLGDIIMDVRQREWVLREEQENVNKIKERERNKV